MMLFDQRDNIIVDLSSIKATHEDLAQLPISHYIQQVPRWAALAMTDLAWSHREMSSP